MQKANPYLVYTFLSAKNMYNLLLSDCLLCAGPDQGSKWR